MGRRFAPSKRFRRGPHTSPAERVVWGESEQGSGRSFRRQAETEVSGLCDDEAEGRLCRPEHFNPEWGPRRALARWGTAAKARYEHLTRLVELYK